MQKLDGGGLRGRARAKEGTLTILLSKRRLDFFPSPPTSQTRRYGFLEHVRLKTRSRIFRQQDSKVLELVPAQVSSLLPLVLPRELIDAFRPVAFRLSLLRRPHFILRRSQRTDLFLVSTYPSFYPHTEGGRGKGDRSSREGSSTRGGQRLLLLQKIRQMN